MPAASRGTTINAYRASRLLVVVVRHLGRALLAEVAEVIYELHREVTTDTAVPRILCISRACRANKCCILVEDVVYTNLYLTSLILEYLATEVEVAQNIVLVIFVCEAEILHIRYCCGQGQTLQEYPLQASIYRVVEIVVLCALAYTLDVVPSLVVCSIPRNGEVDIL